MDPYEWARMYYNQEGQRASQRDSEAQQMLMNIFQEEAARQRPYVTMPARLAEAELDRRNAEPYNERAAMRRYKYSKAGQEETDEAVSEDGIQTDENGKEFVMVGGKKYPI